MNDKEVRDLAVKAGWWGCEGWWVTAIPRFRLMIELAQQAGPVLIRNCELRLMDTRGEEREFNNEHVGTYIYLPGSLKREIGQIIGSTIYSVSREKITKHEYGDRIFVQTGETAPDGYLYTFEVMGKKQCEKIIGVLTRPITQELLQESENDYQALVKKLAL